SMRSFLFSSCATDSEVPSTRRSIATPFFLVALIRISKTAQETSFIVLAPPPHQHSAVDDAGAAAEQEREIAGREPALILGAAEHERDVGGEQRAGVGERVERARVGEAGVVLRDAAHPRRALVAGEERDVVVARAGAVEHGVDDLLRLIGDREEDLARAGK